MVLLGIPSIVFSGLCIFTLVVTWIFSFVFYTGTKSHDSWAASERPPHHHTMTAYIAGNRRFAAKQLSDMEENAFFITQTTILRSFHLTASK